MSNELKVGWGFRDVSTTEPTCIRGQFYIRISQGVMDPVTVTALAIESNGEQAVMLSCDATSLPGRIIPKIRANIRQLVPEVDAAKVIMNATHTHCAGDVYGCSMCDPDVDFPVDPSIKYQKPGEFEDFFAQKCAEAVADAWNGRAAGCLAWGYGFAATGYSRKVWYFDDISKRPTPIPDGGAGVAVNRFAAMYGNTNDDQFSHYEAGADHFVNMMFTFDAQQKLTGAIINLSCPSQCSESIYKLTADFWNEVRIILKAKYGDINILPQCAPAGDLAPFILHYKAAKERRMTLKYGAVAQDEAELRNRRDIAERICEAFDDTFSWAKKDIRHSVRLRNSVEKIELERRQFTQEEYDNEIQVQQELENIPFRTDGTPEECFKDNSILASRRGRCKKFLERCELVREGKPYISDLHVIAIDDIAFVTSPFELYMDFMHRIQARSPFIQTFNIQLADNENDSESGYLATERGVEGGGYSSSRYCNVVSPAGGQQLVEATLKRLNSMI